MVPGIAISDRFRFSFARTALEAFRESAFFTASASLFAYLSFLLPQLYKDPFPSIQCRFVTLYDVLLPVAHCSPEECPLLCPLSFLVPFFPLSPF